MNRPATRLTILVISAFAFGWVTGRIPGSDNSDEFWVSNIGAPYLAAGFLAGVWTMRRPAAAALAGAATAIAMVLGFYNFFAIPIDARQRMGLPPGSSEISAAWLATRRWFALLAWGSTPWLTIAVVTGLLLGYLGFRWRTSGSRIGAFLVAAVLCAEPLLYLSRRNARIPGLGPEYGRSPHNLLIWGVEFVAGLVVLIVAVHGPRRTTAAEEAPERIDAPA